MWQSQTTLLYISCLRRVWTSILLIVFCFYKNKFKHLSALTLDMIIPEMREHHIIDVVMFQAETDHQGS